MNHISVDFSKPQGVVKPLHGVGGAPVQSYYNYDLFHYFEEAGIPYCRLHDIGGEFGGAHFVDVENIFTNMDADENDPASYDFAITDRYMEELNKVGTEAFYRLGATIENGHRIKAYHIYPPRDNEKWARICANIIRHYNEGWADGYHFGITYWEIWNEPDNEPLIEDNPMWKGTKEQFFEHYKVVSRHLKKEFPHIKVGGYASCGFYAAEKDPKYNPAANCSPRFEYFVEFFHAFMQYITTPGNECPLDFFSWHGYTEGVENFKRHAAYARRELDRYGFTETESILNEWNPHNRYKGTAMHMAEIASVILALHHTSVDLMAFYTGDLAINWGSLFKQVRPYEYTVTKEYYVFYEFNQLYRLKQAVEMEIETEDIYALAAADEETGALMVVNNTGGWRRVTVNGLDLHDIEVWCTHEEHTRERADTRLNGDELTLPPYALMLIKGKR